jgi:hypothetical protein
MVDHYIYIFQITNTVSFRILSTYILYSLYINMGTIKHIITLRLNHYIHYPLKLLDFDQTISREFVQIYLLRALWILQSL